MAKSIQTNFSLRLADKSKPILIADKGVASALDSKNFYSTLYTVDSMGTYLGEIREFIAVECKSPILIEFQRVDMPVPNEMLCERLFINHGNLGKVWLKVPRGVAPVPVTVWYSSDALKIEQNEYITCIVAEGQTKTKRLPLRNLNGSELSVPLFNRIRYKGLNKVGSGIEARTYSGDTKTIPVHVISK